MKKADGKSAKPLAADAGGRLSGERLQRVRAAARAKARLCVLECVRVVYARGLLEQLRAAGWIPAHVAVDETVRQRQAWRDEAGRRCVLQPYGGLQWKVTKNRLAHEAEAARRAQAEAERMRARAADAARERAALQAQLDGLPRSAAQYRASLLHVADVAFACLLEHATDRWPGCRVDAGALDELREALAAARAALQGATYIVDPRAALRVRAALQRLEARSDDAFQAFMHKLGPAADEPPRN